MELSPSHTSLHFVGDGEQREFQAFPAMPMEVKTYRPLLKYDLLTL